MRSLAIWHQMSLRRALPQHPAALAKHFRSTTSPVRGGGFGLDGLVEGAIETLYEGGWVFEWDAFEKEGLVEE